MYAGLTQGHTNVRHKNQRFLCRVIIWSGGHIVRQHAYFPLSLQAFLHLFLGGGAGGALALELFLQVLVHWSRELAFATAVRSGKSRPENGKEKNEYRKPTPSTPPSQKNIHPPQKDNSSHPPDQRRPNRTLTNTKHTEGDRQAAPDTFSKSVLGLADQQTALPLEGFTVISPHDGGVDVGRRLVVRVREHRDDRDYDAFDAEDGTPALLRGLL